MRTRLVYTALLIIAASGGYWYAVHSGRGPDLSPARGAEFAAAEAGASAIPEAADLPSGVQTDTSPVRMDSDERNNVQVYRDASPAVVNITTRAVELDFFFGPVPVGGSGSGFLVDSEGHIVTNNHVIAGAENIRVTLADQSSYEAEVVGADPLTDLALLRIDAGDARLPALTLGDSANLRVGQKVLAIGNPFGLAGTLTTGVISAVERSIDTGQGSFLDEAIQTDAAINPGNSGGPLLDSQGRVIGVNTMIQSPSGGSVGLGFAVPVNTLKFVLSDLLEVGRVRRGSLGISGAPLEMLPGLVDYLDLPIRRGVVIGSVLRGGAADEAGLRGGTRLVIIGRYRWPVGGDVITSVAGEKVAAPLDINRLLYKRRPGVTVAVEYYRDGERHTVQVELKQRADERRRRRGGRF